MQLSITNCFEKQKVAKELEENMEDPKEQSELDPLDSTGTLAHFDLDSTTAIDVDEL